MFCPPNTSMARQQDASGLLVQPQNSATMPSAAPRPGASPSSGATAQPKVAPVKKMGTISPPLNPAPSVMLVNSILSRKAYGTACPATAAAITLAPAPL